MGVANSPSRPPTSRRHVASRQSTFSMRHDAAAISMRRNAAPVGGEDHIILSGGLPMKHKPGRSNTDGRTNKSHNVFNMNDPGASPAKVMRPRTAKTYRANVSSGVTVEDVRRPGRGSTKANAQKHASSHIFTGEEGRPKTSCRARPTAHRGYQETQTAIGPISSAAKENSGVPAREAGLRPKHNRREHKKVFKGHMAGGSSMDVGFTSPTKSGHRTRAQFGNLRNSSNIFGGGTAGKIYKAQAAQHRGNIARQSQPERPQTSRGRLTSVTRGSGNIISWN